MEKDILIGPANRGRRKVVQREYSRTEMERGVLGVGGLGVGRE